MLYQLQRGLWSTFLLSEGGQSQHQACFTPTSSIEQHHEVCAKHNGQSYNSNLLHHNSTCADHHKLLQWKQKSIWSLNKQCHGVFTCMTLQGSLAGTWRGAPHMLAAGRQCRHWPAQQTELLYCLPQLPLDILTYVALFDAASVATETQPSVYQQLQPRLCHSSRKGLVFCTISALQLVQELNKTPDIHRMG